jgi:hypothetical protein
MAQMALGEESSPQCAKDMFFDQLDAPKEEINTGLKYWIQLRHGGKISLVDNRKAFESGDEIRFLLVPNINGYAYIVLKKGSTGQEKVLFPNKYEPSGKVVAGRQYILPSKGYLQFDKNKGTEFVGLVVSRHPLSASSLLGGKCLRIANKLAANKPLQQGRYVVAAGATESKAIEVPTSAGSKPDESTAEFSKDLNYVPQARSVQKRKRLSTRALRAGKKLLIPAERGGAITVINVEPAEDLNAEIELVHN